MSKKSDDKTPTQTELLMELASHVELFHTSDQEAYATVLINGHLETWRLDSNQTNSWLSQRLFSEHNKVAHVTVLKNVIRTLSGMALHKGDTAEVHTRLAEHNGKLYLDLANSNWEVVEISSRGWKVISNPPVKFRRSRGMRALPEPQKGGSIDDLRPFINGSDDDFKMIVAWLIQAFMPEGPYPILFLTGEQGSAKSSVARLLRALIDPNLAPNRTEPYGERNLMITAKNSWVLSIDNLSEIDTEFSDSLCRLSTGGGLGHRQNYTDDGEVIFHGMRPVIINGIGDIVTQSDLLDRVIRIELPTVPPKARTPERVLAAQFEKARPKILGALLTALSRSLRNRKSVKLKELPRMADFALNVTAAESALGWKKGEFIDLYKRKILEANSVALENNPLAQGVIHFMARKTVWRGSATDLLVNLKDSVPWSIQKQKGWPVAANLLSRRLSKVAADLKAAGIRVTIRRKNTGSWIEIQREGDDGDGK